MSRRRTGEILAPPVVAALALFTASRFVIDAPEVFMALGAPLVIGSFVLGGLIPAFATGAVAAAFYVDQVVAADTSGEVVLAWAGCASVVLVAGFVSWYRASSTSPERRSLLEARREIAKSYALVDSVEGVIWEATSEPFRFTKVMGRADEVFGWPKVAWRQRDFLQRFVHPHDLQEVQSTYASAALRSGATTLEFRVRTRDDRTLWVSDAVLAEQAPGDGAPVLRGRMIDITAHKRAERRLAAMLGAHKAITEAESLEGAASQVLQAICEALDWSLGAAWQVDDRNRVMRCVEVWHTNGQDPDDFAAITRETTFEKGVGLPGRVWEGLRPAWISDVVMDDNFPRAPYADKVGLHAAFAFPIVVDEKFFGVFEFFSPEIEEPDPELLVMSASLGHRIGEWIRRRRIQEETRFQKALLESQSEKGIEGIMIVSEQGQILSMNRRFRELWEISQLGEDVEDSEIIRYVLGQIEDPGLAVDSIFALHEDLGQDYRGEVVLRDGRVFDLWTAPIGDEEGRFRGRGWYFHDITLEKRSERALKQSKERLQFLSEAGQVLAAALGYEETVKAVVTLAVPTLADWCALDVVERGDRVVRVTAMRKGEGVVLSEPDVRRLDMGASFGPDHAIAQGESEVHRQAGSGLLAALGKVPKDLRPSDGTSALVIPFMAQGRVRGVMTVVSVDKEDRYGSEEQFLVEALARRAGLALDNALLYEERSRIASTLQESLKPQAVPHIPGMDIAARYVAAGEASDVGGDFYDVFPYGDKRWAIVIGDVSGKGPRAAALMGMVRHTIRFEAAQEREPRRILAVLNESLANEADEDQFCSLAYVRLEMSNGSARLTIVCAGHPPPILVRKGGKTELLSPSGPVLGIQRHAEFGEHLVDLGPGEEVVLYTDGVIEARSQEEMFGIERLQDLVAKHSKEDPERLVEVIEAEARSFAKDLPRDDIAVLAFKLKD